MRESMMNYGSCDLPQSQGIISLPNDEEQGAYQAPSPHRNSFIQDPYVLNETLGEFEPVEPFRFLEHLPGIKNTTRVAFQAAGQCMSSQEWDTELQPLSHHHSLTPDDIPRSLGYHSNDVDNPYIVSETSPVADNDLLCLNRQSHTVVKPHRKDSIDALRDSPRSLEHPMDYVHHVCTVSETYQVSNPATHGLSSPCDAMPKPYRHSVKPKPQRQPASHGWWPAESSNDESIHRMSFETAPRSPRHKSDLGLLKGMPQPQVQYTNCSWCHAESEEDECTSRASSKSMSTSS
jgi:hypothetical protein